jgi:hypothetical protein
VEPKPNQTARVFVGRVEVLSPATLKAVESAIAANDTGVVKTYGRFLGPIMERLGGPNTGNFLNAAFKDYISQAGGCTK